MLQEEDTRMNYKNPNTRQEWSRISRYLVILSSVTSCSNQTSKPSSRHVSSTFFTSASQTNPMIWGNAAKKSQQTRKERNDFTTKHNILGEMGKRERQRNFWPKKKIIFFLQREKESDARFRGEREKNYRSGFPWLNPKLELTIMATQKAMKMMRNTKSLHFLLCLMMPPSPPIRPSSLPPEAAAAGYRPMIAPSGPPISSLSEALDRERARGAQERTPLGKEKVDASVLYPFGPALLYEIIVV